MVSPSPHLLAASSPLPCPNRTMADGLSLDLAGDIGYWRRGPGHPGCDLCSRWTEAHSMPAGLESELEVFRVLRWRRGEPHDSRLCQAGRPEAPPSSGLCPRHLPFHVCSFVRLSHKHLSRTRGMLGSGKSDLGEEDRLEAGRTEALLSPQCLPIPDCG